MARSSSRRFAERPDLCVPRGGPADGRALRPTRSGVLRGHRQIPRHRPVPGRPERLVVAAGSSSTPSRSCSTGTRTRSSCSTWPSPPQAAYAAPLILLAQNRQDDRDRANIDRDREVAARPRPTPSTWPANSPPSASRWPTW